MSKEQVELSNERQPNDERPSRAEQKRLAQELQDLGMKLLELPQADMAHFSLPEEVIEALAWAREIDQRNRGALRRQHQRIGSLMVEMNPEHLREEFRRYRAHLHVPKASNSWAELLIDDESAMTEFCKIYPNLDHQNIRQIIRTYKKSQGEEKKAWRRQKLIKTLRKLGI